MRRTRSPCCARTASGNVASPPSSVMKSLRFTASDSRASDRKDSTPRHGRLLHPSSWAERDDRESAAENFFQGGSPKTGHPPSENQKIRGIRGRGLVIFSVSLPPPSPSPACARGARSTRARRGG